MSATRPVSAILVGRIEEARLLRRALADLAAGRPGVVVVQADPGMGRRRLVDEALAALGPDDVRVLHVRGGAGLGPGAPAGPLLHGLLRLAAGLPPGTERAAVEAAVRRLDGSRSVSLRAPLALATVALELCRDRPLIVRVDDLAAAGAVTLGALAPLTSGAADLPVLTVVTLPRAPAALGEPLEAWLGDQAREPRTTWLVLEPLDAAETLRVAEALTGRRVDAGTAAALVARSGGEPLAVEALLAAAVADPARPIELPEVTALPASFRSQLAGDAAALAAGSRTAAVAAALLGRPADPDLLVAVTAGLLGCGEDRALDGVREALRHRVLVREADGLRLGVRRPLLSELLAADLLAPDARRVHEALARGLTARPSAASADPRGPHGEVAAHWQAAGRTGEALTSALEAAAAAESAEAYAVALRERLRVLELLPAGTPVEEELDHLLRAEVTATHAGDARQGVGLARRALALIEPAVDPLRAARLEGDLAYHLWVDGRADEALAAHLRGIALVPVRPPSRARARALRKYAGALLGLGRYRDAVPAAEAALRAARAAGAIDEEGRALDMLGMARVGVGRLGSGIAALEAAVRLAGQHDAGEAHVVGCYNLAYHLLLAERAEEAVTWARAGHAAAESSGLVERFGPYLRGVEADALVRAGRLDEADAAIAAGEGGGPLDGRSLYLLTVRGRLETLRASWSAAHGALHRAGELAGDDIDFDQVAFLQLARAELALGEGRDADAHAALAAGLAAFDGRDDRYLRPVLEAALARVLARLAGAARTHGDAATLAAAEAELAAIAQPDRSTPGLAILADTIAAERMRAAGRAHPGAWRGIARRWERLGRPLAAADAWLREAEERRAAGRGSRAVAAPLLRANAIADAAGADLLRLEVRALARRARVRLPDTGPVAVPSTAPSGADGGFPALSLDPAERSILELLDLGRPVHEVARTAGIPPAQVRAILARLRARADVPTDAALVDAAVRSGLVRTSGPGMETGATGDRVHRAFLFADIVGSTALLEAMGDEAWAGVRGWFDATLRRAFAANGGREVDHTGDGFFVAFESTVAALACGVEVMRTLDRNRRTSGFAPSVRVAIHAGEARVEGRGYVGRSVHVAARLLGLAEANEILASGPTVAETGWGAAGPARTVTLKGVSEPVEVVPIRWSRPAG